MNNLEAYLLLNGNELMRWLERKVRSWGEISYRDLEELILEGHLDDLIDWQERYAQLVNEMTPALTAALAAGALKATAEKIILTDSLVNVKEWLQTHGAQLVTNLSDESRKAIANILLLWQEQLMNPRIMAQQIRPLIGLSSAQVKANDRYRQNIYETLTANGMSPAKARARALKMATKYASKQHRTRAETIVLTELSFAFNQGADMGVKRAIRQGLMSRCAMRWVTAGTNRVCGRCLELKDKIVGYTDETGVTLPPLHPRCRCVIEYEEIENVMPRRRRAQDGHEIIDKPTYHKLTNWFTKSGGLIIRGEDAEKHLATSGASASYMVGANAAFITDTATVSDVLEEMYHARQDRAKMFGEITEDLVWLKREIDAQKYLLSVASKYKIPEEELAVTRANLADYERQLGEIVNENGVLNR